MTKYCKVFQKRSSLLLYIIGSLAIIGISLIYINNAVTFSEVCSSQAFKGGCFENPLYYSAIGKVLLTYFGLCIGVFLGLLIRPYCLFYLNEEGFWTKNYGFVKWDNVSEIDIENIGFQTVIHFTAKDETLIKMPITTKISRFFKKKKLYIELTGTFNEVNEVYKIMKSYV